MIYQWLVVNVYCEKVCMKSVIDGVKSAGAPLYKAFRERVASEAPELPLALEFSVAVYRFGHSMVRASYDHNRNFGRPDGGDGDRRASFRELFAFTGGNGNGEEITGTSFDRLPSNWPVEWERFVHDDPHHGDHRARNIDTKLAPPLSDMFKESDDAGELGRILRNLAERNLRRSHRLNLPTGQGAVDAINAFDKAEEPESGWVEASVHKVKYTCDGPDVPEPGDQTDGIAPVPGSALGEGAAGDALEQGGMLDATPLWFYVLREAEVTEGDTLGPLGSRIVAEQLVGLVIGDTQSFWHEGSGDGGWSPSEMPVGGAAITDMASVMRASGLIA